MEKRNSIIYWIATGLMCLLMLASAGMYIFNNEAVSGIFTQLGFPTWIIYPLAIAKILGVIAIISDKSKFLKEWAYAGFFFDFVLAFGAHYFAGEGVTVPSLVAIVLLIISYIFNKKR